MSNLIKFLLLFAVNLTANIFIKCAPDWSYDLVSIEAENNTPDKVFVDLVLTRPARGVFALSGFVDFGEDVPDFALVSGEVLYSFTGSNFVKSPFRLSETKFPVIMNTFYKDLIMESLLNCSDNAPRVDDEFVAPLTKRTIYLHDCIISNENMPSKLKSGFYKIIYYYKNHSNGKVEIMAKVYND